MAVPVAIASGASRAGSPLCRTHAPKGWEARVSEVKYYFGSPQMDEWHAPDTYHCRALQQWRGRVELRQQRTDEMLRSLISEAKDAYAGLSTHVCYVDICVCIIVA